MLKQFLYSAKLLNQASRRVIPQFCDIILSRFGLKGGYTNAPMHSMCHSMKIQVLKIQEGK